MQWMATASKSTKSRKPRGAKQSKPAQKLNSGLAAYNARRAAAKQQQSQRSSSSSTKQQSKRSAKPGKRSGQRRTTATVSKIFSTPKLPQFSPAGQSITGTTKRFGKSLRSGGYIVATGIY